MGAEQMRGPTGGGHVRCSARRVDDRQKKRVWSEEVFQATRVKSVVVRAVKGKQLCHADYCTVGGIVG